MAMVELARETQRLYPYERHVACILIAILLGLGVAGIRLRKSSPEELQPLTRVKVIGAVESTELEVPLETTIDEILEQVQLSPDADLSEIDGLKKIGCAEVFVVPFRGKKTFFVTGAVQESKIVVLEGDVTARKILDSILVTEAANVSAFLRRRKFPNGSVIQVKNKREKKCS